MEGPGWAVDPEPYDAFEDIIDGYFPLKTSIGQLLTRLGVDEAIIELSYAPIVHIPNLPHDAPVPLNVQNGRVGLIERMWLYAVMDLGDVTLSGTCKWHWLSGEHDSGQFDPKTRLAEPAFVTGFAKLDEMSPALARSGRTAHRVTLDPSSLEGPHAALNSLGWVHGALRGPMVRTGLVSAATDAIAPSAQTGRRTFLLTSD